MKFAAVLIASCLATSATADATADLIAAGEASFAKRCTACHVVRDAEGQVLAGRRGRTGPNLYQVFQRAPGTAEGFRYGSGMKKWRDAGGAWSPEGFAAYLADPTGYLRAELNDKRARSKMSFRLREDTAGALYAYLDQLGQPEGSQDLAKPAATQ